MIVLLSIILLFLSAAPAVIFAVNQFVYRGPARRYTGDDRPAVSLLIPARNEQESIGAAVESALASKDVELEVLVLDDHSEDQTASIVRRLAQQDARVRLEHAPSLPAGWCGKQHACFRLAEKARHPILAFIDADVRLTPQALRRLAETLRNGRATLVSGIPHQVTVTPWEKLLIPLIHFVLLAYLPMWRMRRSLSPAYGAGCGQLFVADREAYFRAGGHAAIKASMHDGIMLPRAFRRAGLASDLIDCNGLASCRMYQSGPAVWYGLAKNATEGMAAPAAIVPWTILLAVGQVLPAMILIGALWAREPAMLVEAAGLAVLLNLAIRLFSAVRFGQPVGSALLHPVGVSVLLAIQWYALSRQILGVPPTWRGRTVISPVVRA